ncbi:MAG: type VI secretion system baseplate subunit TssF [Gammaproteobacteria bacterium]
MDPLLLKYYNRELQYIREMGGEFAREFPKIAGRLGLDGFDCADPYVERLLEGFGFLTARVQLKIDARYPDLTQHLLEIVYPHYLMPIPSMTVVQFHPVLAEASLAEGAVIPRQTSLRSILGKGEQTPCEYRTTQNVTLWPLEITEAEYFTNMGVVSGANLPGGSKPKAGIRLRIKPTAGLSLQDINLDNLTIFLRGQDDQPMRLYEQLIGNSNAVVVRPTERPAPWNKTLDASSIRQVGFGNDEALIAHDSRSFSGYRLLQEYFAFPERYQFVEFTGLQDAFTLCKDSEIELIVLFDRLDSELENKISPDNFVLFCAPAINLFPKRADRINLSDRSNDNHVVADRTRPLDYEVFQVTDVTGHGSSSEDQQEFLPFYACNDLSHYSEHMAFFALRRERRVLSSSQKRRGPRSSYIGSETYISLVDAKQAPYSGELKQLSVQTLCTNRDLPLQMSLGGGRTDFSLDISAPVEAVRCVAGPTRPQPSLAYAQGEVSWRLINHLSMNYLSLIDNDERQGAAALREMLSLYGNLSEAGIKKQVEGLKSVHAEQVTRRMPVPGPIAFGRGLEITLTLDESAFEGTGVFLLGAVMEQFFARYVSINSFTETRIRTADRGEIMRWPVRTGQRHLL